MNPLKRADREVKKEFLPEKYREWEITVSKVPKVNGYMESVNLMPSSEDFVAVPNLYVSELYSFYQDCRIWNRFLRRLQIFS